MGQMVGGVRLAGGSLSGAMGNGRSRMRGVHEKRKRNEWIIIKLSCFLAIVYLFSRFMSFLSILDLLKCILKLWWRWGHLGKTIPEWRGTSQNWWDTTAAENFKKEHLDRSALKTWRTCSHCCRRIRKGKAGPDYNTSVKCWKNYTVIRVQN